MTQKKKMCLQILRPKYYDCNILDCFAALAETWFFYLDAFILSTTKDIASNPAFVFARSVAKKQSKDFESSKIARFLDCFAALAETRCEILTLSFRKIEFIRDNHTFLAHDIFLIVFARNVTTKQSIKLPYTSKYSRRHYLPLPTPFTSFQRSKKEHA
jgi:hypothetical protein